MTGAVAIVAGSGIDLRPLVDRLEETIPFEAAGMPVGHVTGHAHCFHLGYHQDQPIILQSGRLHAYEGFGYEEIVRPLDWLREHGARTVVFTNAVGALHDAHAPGAILAIDAILPWHSRALQLPDRLTTHFRIPACDGTGDYVWMHGPCYETRAEIALLQRTGAVAVGMSTAPELCRARELGLESAVVSCVTNNCCVPQRLTHAHVVETAAKTSTRLCGLLQDWLWHPSSLSQGSD